MSTPNQVDPTYGEDLAFLRRYVEVVELGSGQSGPRVAVVPEWQGRVMTSTVDAATGVGFGWINRELIASGERRPHMNAYGGEDRFWMGPEGGQFAIFFAPGVPFDLAHWQTPAVIDTDPFEEVSLDQEQVTFRHQARITNWSGAEFRIRIERTIRIVHEAHWRHDLGVNPEHGVDVVAFESESTLTNIGREPWAKDTGLLSIWSIGMFRHSPETTIVIPFKRGADSELGPVVNDAYFGKVPADRLVVGDGALFFKGDGRLRSKIGLTRQRATDLLGSYDPLRRVLTIVQFVLPTDAADYVNSMWELQEDPFGGDVINSYNDGPPAPGAKPLGPFYELETSSPAAALAPDASITHLHRTIHFVGPKPLLDPIARSTLGVGLDAIESALRK